MPPKKNAKQDKAKQAAKQKVVEDKTFGLKNKKKSAKVQQYVKNIQQSVNKDEIRRQQENKEKKERKKAEEAAKRELEELFATTIKQPRVPPGVDPKSIVCEFFRHGKCTKGTRCKFSHDLAVERKGPKVDLYSDKRDAEKEDDNMEEWDQETLEKAIAQKHASENKNRPTDIICKYFLDAVEKRQYGWFWQCPNGKTCKYRHALPPGYVLKSQMKQLLEEEAANMTSVEEEIEEERAKVDAQTPITEEVFNKWKAELDVARKRKAEEQEEERQKSGKMTGREIFLSEGFVAADDASASESYAREVDMEEEIRQMHEKAKKDLDMAKAAGEGAAVPAAIAEAEDLFEEESDDDDILDALAGVEV